MMISFSRIVRRFIDLRALPASFRDNASVACGRKLLGAMQVIHDLRQRLARELFEVRIGPVLDLLFEQCCISLLIFDLAVHVITIEGGVSVNLEREDHRVISAVEKRI
jgi:hypothetical protein